MTNNEKLQAIFDKHGYSEQLKKLSEEVFELQEAVIDFNDMCKYGSPFITNNKHTDKLIGNIRSEIADVFVILKEIMLAYYLDEDDIDEIMQYKIDRQCERDGIC